MGRWLLLIPLMLAAATKVEPGETRQLNGARGRHVYVIDTDSREWEGRLRSFAKDAMTVELESTTRAFALNSISRVDVKGDSVKDGAVAHDLWRPAGRPTFPDVRESLSGVVEFGLIGLGLDALHSHERTIYKAPATFTVTW